MLATRRSRRIYWLVALFVALSTCVASAFDPTGNAVADAFLAAYEGDGFTVTDVSGVEVVGDAVRIASFTVLAVDVEAPSRPIGIARYSGASVKGGRVEADGLHADRVTVKREDVEGRTDPVAGWQGHIMGDTSDRVFHEPRLAPGVFAMPATRRDFVDAYARTTTGSMVFGIQGNSASVASAALRLSEPDSQSLSVEVRFVDVTASGEIFGSILGDFLARVDQQIDTLVADLTFGFRWNGASQRVVSSPVVLSVDNVGSVELVLELSGVSEAVVATSVNGTSNARSEQAMSEVALERLAVSLGEPAPGARPELEEGLAHALLGLLAPTVPGLSWDQLPRAVDHMVEDRGALVLERQADGRMGLRFAETMEPPHRAR